MIQREYCCSVDFFDVEGGTSISWVEIGIQHPLGLPDGIFVDPAGGLSNTQPIDWNDADAYKWGVLFTLGGRVQTYCSIDSITVTPVPELSTYGMMLAGLLLVVGVARSGNRRAAA